MSKTVLALIAILLVLLVSASSGSPASDGTASVSHSFAEPRTIKVWMDTSGSLDRSVSLPASDALARTVVHGAKASRIEVYGFAEGLDALRLPTAVFGLPGVPSLPSCQPRRDELAIFKAVQTRRKSECDEKRRQAEQGREHALSGVSRRLAASIRSLSSRPPSQSTCLFSVLLRCASGRPGETCLVVTDGANEACAPPPKPSKQGGQIIVLLVPRRGDGDRAMTLLAERAKAIRAYVPHAAVLPLFRLESDLPRLIGK